MGSLVLMLKYNNDLDRYVYVFEMIPIWDRCRLRCEKGRGKSSGYCEMNRISITYIYII